MVPMFSTTASCRGLGRAAASGAREVGTLPIAMHLQEPGEVDCRNQKVLSSKGKCVLHYKLQNYNGKFGIFSTYINDPRKVEEEKLKALDMQTVFYDFIYVWFE